MYKITRVYWYNGSSYGRRWAKVDARIKAMRLERWREIIVACNTSGMKKKDWMRIHNISSKSFYRKQKEIREYEMEKAGITAADIPSGQKASEFFDVTKALSQQTVENALPSGNRYNCCIVPQMNNPELMIQVGSYNLYIGSGVTEATLSTVLRVIGRA